MNFTEIKNNKIFHLGFNATFSSVAFVFASFGNITIASVVLAIGVFLTFAFRMKLELDEREKFLSYKALDIGLFPLLIGFSALSFLIDITLIPAAYVFLVIAWRHSMPLYLILKNNN